MVARRRGSGWSVVTAGVLETLLLSVSAEFIGRCDRSVLDGLRAQRSSTPEPVGERISLLLEMLTGNLATPHTGVCLLPYYSPPLASKTTRGTSITRKK